MAIDLPIIGQPNWGEPLNAALRELDSRAGVPGPPGDPGEPGKDGPRGLQGEKGLDGSNVLPTSEAVSQALTAPGIAQEALNSAVVSAVEATEYIPENFRAVGYPRRSIPVSATSTPAQIGTWSRGAVSADPKTGEKINELGNAAASTQVVANAAFVSPVSFRRRLLTFEVFTDANLDSVYLDFAAAGADFNNGFWAEPAFSKAVALGVTTKTGSWAKIAVPASKLNVKGSATYEQLDDIRMVRVKVYSNSGGPTSVKFRRFAWVEDTHPAGVIWRFDDGWTSTYTKAFPVLAAHGHVGTVPLETSRIGVHPDRMTLAQVRALVAGGWEMVNHTLTGAKMDAFTPEQVRAAVMGGYKWLLRHGLHSGARHLCYPGGGISKAVYDETARVCRTGWMNTGARTEIPGTGDPYLIHAYQFMANTTVEGMKATLDKVAAMGGVAMIMLHDIKDSDVTADQVLTATLDAVAAHATAIGLPSFVPSEVWGE